MKLFELTAPYVRRGFAAIARLADRAMPYAMLAAMAAVLVLLIVGTIAEPLLAFGLFMLCIGVAGVVAMWRSW